MVQCKEHYLPTSIMGMPWECVSFRSFSSLLKVAISLKLFERCFVFWELHSGKLAKQWKMDPD